MSRQSYMNGFCKVAAANNVNPQALARYALEKRSQDVSFKDKILAAARDAKDKWDAADDSTKAIAKTLGGAGLGSLLGLGAGSALAGKAGIRAGTVGGALLGAAAGAYGGKVNWEELAKKLGQMSRDAKGRVESAAAEAKRLAEEAAAKAKAQGK